MFKAKFNDKKFKTNVRLCINRLKLVEKKKTEMALKARKEIADYIKIGKTDRARIRVEHIIREDYLVEGLEIAEMFLDLLLARVGLITLSNQIDPGMQESISSVIWVQPRIVTECAELRVVVDELAKKYGKEYIQECRSGMIGTVSKKLQKKLDPHAPPKSLIENYLIEIAKNYNVEFEPDRAALLADELPAEVRLADLIDINSPEDKWGGPPKGPGGNFPGPGNSGGPGNFGGPGGNFAMMSQPGVYNQGPPAGPPPIPNIPPATAPYPHLQPSDSMRKASDSLPSTPDLHHLPSYNAVSGPTTPLGPDSSVGTFPMRGKNPGDPGSPGVPDPTPKYDDVAPQLPEIPSLPEIPGSSSAAKKSGNNDDDDDDDDFDDLEKRFAALKKK